MTNWVIGWLHVSAVLVGVLFLGGATAGFLEGEWRCAFGMVAGAAIILLGLGWL